VATGIAEVRADRPQLGFLVITHYQRILDHLPPDVVYVLVDGHIVTSGGPEVARQVEAEGFDAFRVAQVQA
jgi:Fe-S cluster assembly ATP-binding protein